MSAISNSSKINITTIIVRIVIVISLVEFAIMLLFSITELDLPVIQEALLDAALLSLFSSPFIYLWIIKPFIHARDNAEQHVRHLALHDPLTSLPNRRLLEEHLEKAISHCVRDKTYSALLLIDLDGFKPVNDRYGHNAGDMILTKVANCLLQALRQSDIAARLGGDEFVALLNNMGNTPENAAKSALVVAEKIRQGISQPITLSGQAITVNASIGVRIITPNDNNNEIIIRDADDAMYQSKKHGRAQSSVFQTASL